MSKEYEFLVTFGEDDTDKIRVEGKNVAEAKKRITRDFDEAKSIVFNKEVIPTKENV